jgi:hypothetical protein
MHKVSHSPFLVSVSDGSLVFFSETLFPPDDMVQNIRVQKISNTDGYYWPAELISEWIDAGSLTDWSTLEVEGETPSDSSAEWQTRTCNYPNLALAGTEERTEGQWFAVAPCVNDGRYETPTYLTPWFSQAELFYNICGDIEELNEGEGLWIGIDLGYTTSVGHVIMRSAIEATPSDYEVQVWADSDNDLVYDWETVAEVINNTAIEVETSFEPVETSRVRLYIKRGNLEAYQLKNCHQGGISEIEIYATNPCSEWEPLDGNQIQSPDGRALQYKVNLSASSDYLETPHVDSVTANYTSFAYPTSGTYTSDVLDSESDSSVWNSLSADFNLTSGSSISFSVQSGDTPSPDGS